MAGILFGSLFALPENAWAVCLNSYQTQTLAAAYEGDAVPTVHTIEACGGDDVSYQIPIATTINFDGVEYNSVYATTNSVITFGQPDNTYWTYPSTPSISLYSMDWVIYPSENGWGRPDESMTINYSEGGFQVSMNLRPIWLQSQPDPVNIVINAAITNTGGLAISYSTAFPATGVAENYPGLRTGVRLHNGQVVSLESAGFYEVQNPQNLQLNATPVDEDTYVPGQPTPTPTPTPTPESTPTPMTPEEQQAEAAEALTLANDISNINNLIAAINGEQVEDSTNPTVTEEPEAPIEDPDVVVEPEIITPEDPRFPDEEVQTEPEDPNPSPSSDTTSEENVNEDPSPEPSEEPVLQPEDTNSNPDPEQQPVDILEPVDQSQNNNNIINGLSEEELKKINKVISANDAKLLAVLVGTNKTIKQAVEEFTDRAEENVNAPMPYTVADAIVEVQAEKLLQVVSTENLKEIFSNPTEAVGALVGQSLEVISNPSEWGKDMTDDQREKAQEVIIPVILVSNIVSSVMSLRRI